MKNKSKDNTNLNDILSCIKGHLLFQEDSGLELLQVSKYSLLPLLFKSIKSAVSNCYKCQLSSSRTNSVFGEGSPEAELMFVGEAPGAEEDRTGRPFIGRAGELLDRIIRAINLSREDVFITSVVKCHPPENRTPLPEEISACKPFLINQIYAIRPLIICSLGTTATQTILNTDEPIAKLRGVIYEFKGVKVMPTFHPAYLLRNPNAKRLVWEDMQKLQKLYEQLNTK